jgi:hypothetical protein
MTKERIGINIDKKKNSKDFHFLANQLLFHFQVTAPISYYQEIVQDPILISTKFKLQQI